MADLCVPIPDIVILTNDPRRELEAEAVGEWFIEADPLTPAPVPLETVTTWADDYELGAEIPVLALPASQGFCLYPIWKNGQEWSQDVPVPMVAPDATRFNPIVLPPPGSSTYPYGTPATLRYRSEAETILYGGFILTQDPTPQWLAQDEDATWFFVGDNTQLETQLRAVAKIQLQLSEGWNNDPWELVFQSSVYNYEPTSREVFTPQLFHRRSQEVLTVFPSRHLFRQALETFTQETLSKEGQWTSWISDDLNQAIECQQLPIIPGEETLAYIQTYVYAEERLTGEAGREMKALSLSRFNDMMNVLMGHLPPEVFPLEFEYLTMKVPLLTYDTKEGTEIIGLFLADIQDRLQCLQSERGQCLEPTAAFQKLQGDATR